MKKKITTEEEFFANNPSAKKSLKQEKKPASKKEKPAELTNNQKNLEKPTNKHPFNLKFLEEKRKEKVILNKTKFKNFFNKVKKSRVFLFFSKKKITKLKPKSSIFFQPKENIDKKKTFMGNIVTGGLLFSLLFFAGGFFIYHESVYKEKEKELTKLQKTLTYLESKEKEIQKLQTNFYQKYDNLENSIEEILKKLNITQKILKIINTNGSIKVLVLNVSNVNYQQLVQLIYEIENYSPTMIISDLVIAINFKGNFNISMNITGLL